MTGSYIVMFRGRRACPCLTEWLPWYEKMLLQAGVIKHNIDIAQLIGGAAASAGTHTKGGAFDLWQTQPKAIALARKGGADPDWHRTPTQGFAHHQHGVLRGCPHNTPARYQVAAVDAGYNGLGANGHGAKDDGPRPLSGRTYKQGIAWMKEQLGVVPASDPQMDPAEYGPGHHGPHITWYGERLVIHGYGRHYTVGPGPTWGQADKDNTREFQAAFHTPRTDGYPDQKTLDLLAGAPQVPPPPATLEPCTFRGLNINVCGFYPRPAGTKTYRQSLGILNQVRNDARASLVWATESNNYDAGEALNKAFGWGGQRAGKAGVTRPSFVLHGGSLGITTALHWDPDRWRLLDDGLFVTLPGSTHRWGTWVTLEHLASHQPVAHGITHLQYLPKGPNTVKRYEVEKHDQLSSMLRQLDVVADAAAKRYGKPVPRLCAGDFNSDRNDMYDASVGVGKAIAQHGYADAAVAAHAHIGGNQPQIDRVAVKGVGVDEHLILPTRGGTDHPTAVAVRVTVP